MSAPDPLNLALDRFAVPPLRAGFADRVVAAATALPPPAAPRESRDRRGLWRRGRQLLLGTAGVGLLSAAAVASGLLGRVGIEVPVLTAMLAPASAPAPAPKPKTHVAPKPAKVAVAAAPAVAPPVAPTLADPEERLRLRAERRARIARFAEQHPQVAAVVAQRVRAEMRRREVERRAMLGLPPADPSAPDWRPLTPEERFVLRQERLRDFRRAEAMLDRRLAARQARIDAEAAAASQGNSIMSEAAK